MSNQITFEFNALNSVGGPLEIFCPFHQDGIASDLTHYITPEGLAHTDNEGRPAFERIGDNGGVSSSRPLEVGSQFTISAKAGDPSVVYEVTKITPTGIEAKPAGITLG